MCLFEIESCTSTLPKQQWFDWASGAGPLNTMKLLSVMGSDSKGKKERQMLGMKQLYRISCQGKIRSKTFETFSVHS